MIRVLLLFLLPIVIYAKADIKVYFKGNKTLSSKYLYENLDLVIKKSWFEFYKDGTPKIDKVIIKPLKESLIKLYKSEGFFKVKVNTKLSNKKMVFMIDENTPIKIRDINSSKTSDIRNFLKFKVGDRFIIKKFISIRESLKRELKSRGYCNYDLKTKAYIDLKKYYVDLVYKLKKNKKCKFGKIDIKSPKDIRAKVILSRLFYKSGDDYSSKKILKSYENVLGLDIFDTIDIKENIDGDRIDTDIKVTKKRVLIRREIGIGYETQYGAKTFFHWEQRNFKGEARKLAFDFKYSNKEQYIKNTFFNPAFIKLPVLNRYFDLKNEFSYSKTKYDRFDEKKFSDIFHLQKNMGEYALDMGIDFENIDVKKKGDYCSINDGHFVLLSPFIRAIIDKRDSKIDPKNGIYLSAYWENGLTYLASSTSYSKLFLEARAIKTINDFTIAVKGKVGVIKELEKSLPESKLFFAGGSFSNRAYGYNRLGAYDGGCDDLGGKSVVDNSLEISHPITQKISMALFWDATMLSMKEDYFDLDFIHSYGIGLRYNTIIGPIKLDYGVNAKDSSIYAIHFQIGQSF
jgi:outer membrane protein assembly factor BamA